MAAIAMASEDGEMVSPSEGDAVSFTIEGTVEGVDGDTANIAMETVNGQPAYPEEEIVEAEVVEGPSRDELMAEMVGIDAAGGL